LNALLNEERHSSIAGTTRDTIEDELVIGGIAFFIDTAGIRETKDVVSIGIKKTFEKIERTVVLYLFDSLKFKVQSSEYIIEIEKSKISFL
jgi:tRNA modification GTPase